MTSGVNRVIRVDRRGYSGTSHAAMHTLDGRLRTLCGRHADGIQWHASSGLFNPAEIACKRCKANFPFA
jgi:hypothetical protein